MNPHEIRPSSPVSEGGSSVPAEPTEPKTELIFRISNESNANDGVFGPLTYGFRGSHLFGNDFRLEAGLIRLHEPGTPLTSSLLDEAQLTLQTPQFQLFDQPLLISATAWANRTIDLVTPVAGIELTRTGDIAVHLGFYHGMAARGVSKGRFSGVQLGLSGSVGVVELALAHLNGTIDEGFYRKSSFEAAVPAFTRGKLPVNFTLAVEDRYYSFGPDGPASEPSDELILILGAELRLESLLFREPAR